MYRKLLTSLACLGFILTSCQSAISADGTPDGISTGIKTETQPPPAMTTLTHTPDLPSTLEPRPTSDAIEEPPERPEEAILITEPGYGSLVTNPIRVTGVADPTFEQNLVIRVVLDDGTELTQTATTIQAEIGQRGEYEAEVSIDLETKRNIFIQVSATSPRDGSITHLSSTVVMFLPEGTENISSQEPQPEQLAILQPQNGGTFSGGVAHVEGFALATFEQTLIVEVLDAAGNLVGSGAITVQSPDVGQPGAFSVDVAYSITEAGPGRILIRDPRPAFDGDTHINSVEVNLQP